VKKQHTYDKLEKNTYKQLSVLSCITSINRQKLWYYIKASNIASQVAHKWILVLTKTLSPQ